MPAPGDVLEGKYRIERVLGVGGMGVVMAATHLELDEPVAVKFLLPQGPAQPDAVARFVREAKAAIKIKSEHVVRVVDTGRLASGAPYFVMEYLDGRDLHAVVEEDGPLAIDVAVDYVLQACDAIAAAHAIGIVHRDLKPGNLFLTRRASGAALVKVLDFGISKVMNGELGPASGLTTTATIMGTPAFMSPEQLRSTRHVDARADLWSLGTILYALMTGEPPYGGDSTADIAAKIIRDPPPPLRAVRPDAPEGVEAVILRCLEKDADARYADVAELVIALLPFAPAESRASAERLAKQISSRQIAHAPTVRSSSKPSFGAPADAPRGSSDATRTASAWGGVKAADASGAATPAAKKAGRAGIVVLGTVAAAMLGATVALVVPRTAPPAAASATATTASMRVAPPAPSASVPPPATSAPPVPSAAPSAAPPATSATSATPPVASAAAPNKRAPRSTKPGASASPAPPSPPTGTGLFDDRE